MSLFQFQEYDVLSFFAVLIRFSVLFAVLPFIGDRVIPGPIKILSSFIISFLLFPSLVRGEHIRPLDALKWGGSLASLVQTIGAEALFGFLLGFVAKLIFDGINIGANWVGSFMGLATANNYDSHQESQTGIVAQIQTTFAMILFLTLDGHHLMLKAALGSYQIVGLGSFHLTSALIYRITQMSGEILEFALRMSAPISLSLASVNIIFGILSKAMPQLNVFVLSFAVSLLIGFGVMYLSFVEIQAHLVSLLIKMGDWMLQTMRLIQGGV